MATPPEPTRQRTDDGLKEPHHHPPRPRQRRDEVPEESAEGANEPGSELEGDSKGEGSDQEEPFADASEDSFGSRSTDRDGCEGLGFEELTL